MLKYFLALTTALTLFSCNDPEAAMEKEEIKKDSVVKEEAKKQKNVLKKYTQLTDEPGVIGIFEVPEMLSLCRKDSATASDMAKAFAKNYGLLEKDMAYLNLKSGGAAGSIYYNNDTTNFIFECVYPLTSFPEKKPKHSTVVVLEASPMLIYNHYGEYIDLHFAYDNIKNYVAENELEQAGPLREFYITNPEVVTDHSKWLTRIMVPVMNKKKK